MVTNTAEQELSQPTTVNRAYVPRGGSEMVRAAIANTNGAHTKRSHTWAKSTGVHKCNDRHGKENEKPRRDHLDLITTGVDSIQPMILPG